MEAIADYMSESLGENGMGGYTMEGFEEFLTNMANHYVISGDYASGTFDVGFAEAMNGNITIKTAGQPMTVKLNISKLRASYKDYLIRDQVTGVEESMVMNMNQGGYNYHMEMNMEVITYSTYSYVYYQ